MVSYLVTSHALVYISHVQVPLPNFYVCIYMFIRAMQTNLLVYITQYMQYNTVMEIDKNINYAKSN